MTRPEKFPNTKGRISLNMSYPLLTQRKSTGADNIPAKIIKSCISPISGVLANLIRNTLQHSKFPVSLKGAQVVPIHKKNDPLNKRITDR